MELADMFALEAFGQLVRAGSMPAIRTTNRLLAQRQSTLFKILEGCPWFESKIRRPLYLVTGVTISYISVRF